jgi:hypothetical protein
MANFNFLYGNDGYILINPTGGTSNGRVLLRLTDFTLGTARQVDTTQTFDMPNFTSISRPTTFEWTVSATGIVSDDTGESEFQGSSSGDTRIVNTYNGLELLEVMKEKNQSAVVTLKLASANWQRGTVVITKFDISGSVGSKNTYSLEMQGSGLLTKLSS